MIPGGMPLSFWKMFSNEGLNTEDRALYESGFTCDVLKHRDSERSGNQTYHDEDFLPGVSNLAVFSRIAILCCTATTQVQQLEAVLEFCHHRVYSSLEPTPPISRISRYRLLDL